MSENSTSTIVPLQRHRIRRKASTGSASFSIEELFSDEMGYDADIEVIHPDQYEDAESDSDSESYDAVQVKSRTVDEELADRMRRLGREHVAKNPQPRFLDRGRKRTSWELEDEGNVLDTPLSPDLEIQEMVDHALHQPSPAKRRKKRSKLSGGIHHILRNQTDIWIDSSEKVDTGKHLNHNDSESSSSASEGPARDDAETMDVT